MLTMLKPFGTLMGEPKLLRGIVNVEGIDFNTPPAKLQEKISKADILLGNIDIQLDDEVFEKAPKLIAVVCRSIGLDFIDVKAASRRNILVVNSPTFCVKAVAEYVIGMMFILARDMVSAATALNENDWGRRELLKGIELENRTLGLIGYGKIGKEVAWRARGLGMQVLAYSPSLSSSKPKDEHASLCSIKEILQKSDVLSIHTPLTKKTLGMIGEKEIATMKDGAIIINLSRGGIVDEKALVEALKSGKLKSAALDAFTQEPPQHGHVLYKPELPNLILTPHVAWNTVEAGIINTNIFVEQVSCIAQGKQPPGIVNPDILDSWFSRIHTILDKQNK